MDKQERRWPNEECGLCQRPIGPNEPWKEVRIVHVGQYEVHVACMTEETRR